MMRLCSVVFLLVFIAVFAVKANSTDPRPAPQLYRRYCVSCHGSDGRAKTSKGKFAHARDLSDAQWHEEVTDERIFNSIMNGRSQRGNMPPFSNKIDQKEAEALVNFVRRFRAS
jgi:mono/diheme cytochrome c family protein